MVDVALRDRRQALLDQADLQGREFCRRYAQAADEWLAAIASRAAGSARHLALLAVGGYGRGELCPFSDLDVVLVHDGHRDISTVADAIWYPVWDQGVSLDHSVRRPREVLDAASADLRVALGLLDARMVWGDPKVAEPLLEAVLQRWRESLGARWMDDLADQMARRHETQGDVAFLLEPDLKECHGGLRDVHVLRAVAAYAPALAEDADMDSLIPPTDVLTAVRVELHRGAQRSQDRLLLQDQDQVAAALAYRDADALMADVASAGRRIAWVSDTAWRRRRFWQPAPPRRFLRSPIRPATRTGPGSDGADRPAPVEDLEAGIAVGPGEVILTPSAPIDGDPSLALRLAAVAAERDLPIAQASLHRLADRMPPPPDPWPAEARAALVRLLSCGPAAIEAFEALDQHGLIVRLLPEWRAVRNKPQRNAYHRYTVDRHLLETAAHAATLAPGVARPDLLLIGALLHDIGKGYPGDHTDAGVVVAEVLGARLGLPGPDRQTVVRLVRRHLLLADTATRRDLDDPATIDKVAADVVDRQTLDLLAALTEADSLATGPSAWGPWKAGLVTELVTRTAARLEGRPPPAPSGWLPDLHHQVAAEIRATGAPVVLLDPPRVVVAAPDRPGLLASVAGVLALHALDVRSADAISEEGVAVEAFSVESEHGRWPDSDRLREDLSAVLAGHLGLGDRLARRAQAYSRAKRPSAAHAVVPEVTVDNAASRDSTVVEVRAPDEIGLLHRITQTLFAEGLDVVSARASTVGSEAVDAFYVRATTGSKLTDPTALSALCRAVVTGLSTPAPPPGDLSEGSPGPPGAHEEPEGS